MGNPKIFATLLLFPVLFVNCIFSISEASRTQTLHTSEYLPPSWSPALPVRIHPASAWNLPSSLLPSLNISPSLAPFKRSLGFFSDRSSMKSVLLYLSVLLLTHAHDTELNPGPYTPKFPCGVCSKAVKWSKTRRAVACDTCDIWYHVDCMGMSSATYSNVNSSNVTWICAKCDQTNISSALLDTFVTESPNSYAPLTDSDSSDALVTSWSTSGTISSRSSDLSSSAGSNYDIGPPLRSSSPRKAKTQRKNRSKPLKVLTVNFQSVRNKKEAFWEAVDSSNPDIIVGCETWLRPDISSSEILPPGYSVPAIRKDRQDGYGGVLIATKTDIIIKELSINTNKDIVAAELNIMGGQKVIIIALYRAPNSDLASTEEICATICRIVRNQPTASIWLSGDLNLPDIHWQSESITGHQYSAAVNSTFINTFQDLGLSQIVDFPTRDKAILDVFLTNRPSLIRKCIALPGISDHDMVLTVADIQAKIHRPIKRKINLWKDANMNDIREEMDSFTDEYLSSTSLDTPIETQWEIIKSKITSVLEHHVPTKMTTCRFSQPWITAPLKRLSRKKKRIYKKLKSSNTEEDLNQYKELKRNMQKECRKAYQSYVSDLICGEGSHGGKRFWTYIKNKRCDSTGVSALLNDGILHTDSETKASLLNNQFSSVFTKEDLDNMPTYKENLYPHLDTIEIRSEGVRKLLFKTCPHKASGPDNIPARLLKECSAELAPVLALLFQSTLHQGAIPMDWKSAFVTPIHKKGSRHEASNYRPISLTSIVCKVLEHIIFSEVISHLESNGILSEKQHGFRKFHSCESQLLLTVHDLAKGLDDKQQIDAVLLDFSKAFDKVPHHRLLSKLSNYGIQGNILRWIKAFLTERTQQVVLDGVKSDPARVSSGVPQGTVLGPLLFLVYINDLPECVSSEVRMFADDCLLYRRITSQADADTLQEDLNHLQEWETKWQMSFNPSKCEVLRVTNKVKNIVRSVYSLHGFELPLVDNAKYLGVHINSKLSWKPHIDYTCKKANSTRGFIQRNLRGCPKKVKEQAYVTYVQPILDYSSSVWDPYVQEQISRLDMVQRRAARFCIGDYHPRHSVTQMLQSLKWQTLHERRAHVKVTMLYRILLGLVAIPPEPPYLYPATRSSGRRPAQFLHQRCRLNSFQHSFFPSVICLWNDLPANVTSSSSLEVFRRRLVGLTLRKD